MKTMNVGPNQLRIEKKEYQGRERLDIRLYFEDDEGEWRPTKKGVGIPLDRVEEFLGNVRAEVPADASSE